MLLTQFHGFLKNFQYIYKQANTVYVYELYIVNMIVNMIWYDG